MSPFIFFVCSAFHLDHLDHIDALANQAPKAKKLRLVLNKTDRCICCICIEQTSADRIGGYLDLDTLDHLEILEDLRRNRKR